MGIGRPRTCECGVCAKCRRREYMREWYYRSGKRTYLDKEKANARARERWATDPAYRQRKMARIVAGQRVRRGQVAKQPCAFCGATAVIHHNDYTKPHELTWLCEQHHTMIHSALPTF